MVLASIIVMTEGMERKYWGVKSRFLNIGSLKKMWSTGERNGKPLQYPCLENPMKSYEEAKI